MSHHPLDQELIREAATEFLEAEWHFYSAKDEQGHVIQAHKVVILIEIELLRRGELLRNTLGMRTIYQEDLRHAV